MVDIPLLVEAFIKRIGERKKPIIGITRSVLDLLMQYAWPGNIRELINVIEYAFVLCPEGQIEPRHLPPHLQKDFLQSAGFHEKTTNGYKDTKRQRLIEALKETGGNQSRAAKILGVSRVTVWKWIKKYGLRLGTQVVS